MKFTSLLILASIIGMSGCTKYILNYTPPIKAIKKDMNFVVLSDDKRIKNAFENVLINNNYNVQVDALDNFFENHLEEETETEENISTMETIVQNLDNGTEMEMSKGMFDSIKKWNNLKDEIDRTSDYVTLLQEKEKALAELAKYYGITHYIYIQNNNVSSPDMDYNVYVVKYPENKIVFNLHYEAKGKETTKKVLGSITSPKRYSYSIGNSTNDKRKLDEMRLAQFFVYQISGGTVE